MRKNTVHDDWIGFIDQLNKGTATARTAFEQLSLINSSSMAARLAAASLALQGAAREIAPQGHDFPPSFPATSRRLLLPAKLLLEFEAGADCTPWLEELVQTLTDDCAWDDLNALLLAGAVAVFMGRDDLLEELTLPHILESLLTRPPEATRYSQDADIYTKCFNAYCQIRAGRLDATTLKNLAAILSMDDHRSSYAYGTHRDALFNVFSAERIPGLCLCVFLLAVLVNRDTPRLRKSYLNNILLDVMWRWNEINVPNVSQEQDTVSFALNILSRNEDGWMRNAPDIFRPLPDNVCSVFLAFSAQYMVTHGNVDTGQEAFATRFAARYGRPLSEGIHTAFAVYLAWVKRAFASRLPVLAATLANLLRLWDERDLVPAVLRDQPPEAVAATLITLDCLPPSWRTALNALQRIAQAATAPTAQKRKMPFHWLVLGLPLEPVKRRGRRAKNAVDFLLVRGILVWRHPRLKNGAFGVGSVVTISESFLDNLDAYELLPEDAPLLDFIRRLRAANPYYFHGNRLTSGELAEALSLLAGHPRVAVVQSDLQSPDYSRLDKVDVAVRRVPAALETSTTSDGELVIAPPPQWELLAATGYDQTEVNLRRAAKFVPAADGDRATLEVPLVSPVLGEALKVLRLHGTKDRLVVPAPGELDTQLQLLEVSQGIPVQGPLGEAADTSNLPHEPLPPTPHLRLCLETDDTLALTLQMLLDVGTRSVLLTPGQGSPSLVLRRDGVATVFTRDLAAEADHLRAMCDYLARHPLVTRLDDTHSRITGIEHILTFLEELQGLPEPWPVDWSDATRRVLKTSTLQSATLDARHMSADQWFALSGKARLDDGQVLPFEELLSALPNRAGHFIRLSSGQYVKISEQLRRKLAILNAAGKVRKGSLEVPLASLPAIDSVFSKADRTADGDEAPNDGGGAALALPTTLVAQAQEIRTALKRTFTLPSAFAGELRPYQKTGFVWLSRLAACRIGACLADDMGLGKTLEIIAVLLARAKDGPSLVVTPTSVCLNWIREINRFAPTLKTRLLQGDTDETALAAAAEAGDVVVVSYGLVVTRGEALFARDWNGVVLDEAQAIKNDGTKRFRAVTRLRATFRIAATGTPVENCMGDFWSIFEFLNPGMLFSRDAFLARYTEDGRATPELKKLVTPLILRRLKKDVLKDLPPKTEINLEVDLDATERAAYEACRRTALKAVEEATAAGVSSGGAGMAVLRELTRLRRFCCHPALVYPDFTGSAKLATLLELLDDLKRNDHKALIFSQFTDYLAIVRREVESRGWSYQYLDGSTSRTARAQAVEDFQSGQGDFFLISLKAGGFGLTLTAANYVILLDPWWNPAVENQAADRVHRIGQTQPVTVYRLVEKDTVEERVLQLHAEKLKMAEDLLEGAGSASLSTAEMIRLFR